MPTFYAWLCTQSRRTDDIGAFARHAARDKLFPRGARHLYIFLLRYDGHASLRVAAKRAHAAYRRARRAA